MAEFRVKKPTLVFELLFEGSWTTSAVFLGSHRKLAAGNRSGQIFIWDLPDQPTKDPVWPVRMLQGHDNGISRLVATRDGKTLVSAGLDRTVRFWDITATPTGSAEAVLDIEQRRREAKKTRKDDALNRPGVKVEVQKDGQVITNHKDWVKALGLSRDEKKLITGDDKAQVMVWDLASRKQLSQWQGYPGVWVSSAALSPDGQLGFVGEYCKRRGDFDRPPAQARFWNVADGKEKIDVLKVLYPKVKVRDSSYGYSRTWGKFVAGGLVTSQFSPDGKLLATGQGGETGTGKVHLLDVETGKLVRSISGHRYGVTDLTFSDDGKYVLSAGRDTQVLICQVADGKEVAKLGKPRGGQFKDWFHAVALSPDQQWVTAADISGRIHVWSLGG